MRERRYRDPNDVRAWATRRAASRNRPRPISLPCQFRFTARRASTATVSDRARCAGIGREHFPRQSRQKPAHNIRLQNRPGKPRRCAKRRLPGWPGPAAAATRRVSPLRKRSYQDDGVPREAPAAKADYFSMRVRFERPAQAGIGPRRRIQARQKPGIGLRVHREYCAIKERFFGLAPGGRRAQNRFGFCRTHLLPCR